MGLSGNAALARLSQKTAETLGVSFYKTNI